MASFPGNEDDAVDDAGAASGASGAAADSPAPPASDPSVARSSELSALRQTISSLVAGSGCRLEIAAANHDFSAFTLSKTQARTISVRVSYPVGYPADEASVEIKSKTLVPGVLKKLAQQANEVAKASKGDVSTRAVAAAVLDLLATGRLLPVYKEMRMAAKLMGDALTTTRTNQALGTVRYTVEAGQYWARFQVTVAEDHPRDPVSVEVVASNFHSSIVKIFAAQATEIARRCAEGYAPEDAIVGSTGMKRPPKTQEGSVVPKVTAQSIKHDVAFLKKAVDLKKMDTGKGKRNQFHEHSTAERRDARRELSRMKKKEAASERLQQQEAKAAALAEAGYTGPTDNDAVDSFLPVVDFLYRKFVAGMPGEICQACKKGLLPADPMVAKKVVDTEKKGRPIRVYCGHWYHFSCLDKFLRSPPFGKQCPADGCEASVYHHRWEKDVLKLEKEWIKKQARQQEMADCADCFGGLGVFEVTDAAAGGDFDADASANLFDDD